MKFTDEEIGRLEAHYGEGLDPELEAKLRDDSPEDDDYLDVRRRYRHLLMVWSGRKAAGHDGHTSHCCGKHGCKYGDKDCPVAAGTSAQEDLCEECEYDVYALKHALPKAEAYARSVAVMDPEGGNYIIVDGEKLRLEKPEAKDGLPESVLVKAQYSDLVWAIQTAYLAGVV